MSLSIRPTVPTYTAPPRAAVMPPVAPTVPAAPAVVPSGAMGDAVADVKDVVRAASRGEELSRPSGLKSAVLGLIRKGQSALQALMPPKVNTVSAQAETPPLTTIEKIKKVGKAAMAFALPVAGAAGVAAGLGWIVGPWVPFVGGHVFGAVAGALMVGQTTGFLMHTSMRLPLITKPEDREYNSAGATLGSAAIGAGLAAIIGGAAGATVGLPLLATGAILGAAPRLLEWAIARI